MYRANSSQAGFTLIEIMVVVVIIGLMATLIAPNIFGQKEKADEIKVRADLKQIESSLALYRLDNYDYPTTSQGLQALVTDPGTRGTWRGYLDKLPKDPWGNDYEYINPGQKNPRSIDVWSLGADGAQGGEGRNKDIGNWEE